MVIITFDGLGVGELPDAAGYGDSGSHTLDNTVRAAGGVGIPNLRSLGLGLIEGVGSVPGPETPRGAYGRMSEASPGKDTTTGHWEIAGVRLERPFPTFPDGFPRELMGRFTEETGRGWLWARPASGTEIIERLGEEHLRTGRPIVYTSADSVLQVAAHVDKIPLEELYEVCEKARRVADEYGIGRVIARPFTGAPGEFTRLNDKRRDYSVAPPEATLLDVASSSGIEAVGVGKLGDIFAHRGLTREVPAKGNRAVVEETTRALTEVEKGLVFSNLGDFDTLWGHRNDPAGYARGLEEADHLLGTLMGALGEYDMLFVTADHGCDPTTESTDHSREYVPLLVFGHGVAAGVDLGTRETFSDLGQTAAEALGVGPLKRGRSFLKEISVP